MKSCKLLAAALLCLFLVCLSGCRIETELWMDNDGAGHGTLGLIDFPNTPDDIRQRLQATAVEVQKVETEQGNRTVVYFQWDNISKLGARIQKQGSSALRAEFPVGNPQLQMVQSTLKVHVNGYITKTTGSAPGKIQKRVDTR